MADWDSLKPMQQHSKIMLVVIFVLLTILIFTPRRFFRSDSVTYQTDSTENLYVKYCVIKVHKAHFHNEPNEESIRKSYLEKGDTAEYSDENNGYLFVVYRNSKGEITKGWVIRGDMEIIKKN